MSGWLQDVRFGLRLLRTRPGFALAAMLTVALGVGANATIFSAVSTLLLRPLPIRDADRVVYGQALRDGWDPFATSFLDYTLYRDEARTLQSVGLGSPRSFELGGRGEPERVLGAAVTASYLATLDVEPPLGRLFTDSEDRPGGSPVALLGHGLWQRRFGGDRAVLGRAVDLGERAYTVVGVLPRGFDMPFQAELWVPMQTAFEALPLDLRAVINNELVARLRPGVTHDQARAELARLAARLAAEHPQLRRGWSYDVVPVRQQLMSDLDGKTRRSLMALMAGVGFLLLLCCANVASLLLARGVARQGELATRLSLGARRSRLVRQLVVESLLLAAGGGVLGVLLALAAQPLLRALGPIQATGLASYLTDFRVDWRVLAFAALVTVANGVLFGLLPAVKVARAGNLAAALERREQRAGSSVCGRRALGLLVVGEVALAVTLLVGAALMAQSFQSLQGSRLGFRPDGLLTMELPLADHRYPDLESKVRFVEALLARVRALPGVQAAGMTTSLPLQRPIAPASVFEIEGAPPPARDHVPVADHRMVSPGYTETLGVTLLAGRFLDARDNAGAEPVAVVSEELVRQAWPGGDTADAGRALGKRLRRIRAGVYGPWMRVVGVVGNVKEDRFYFRIDRPVWYVPYAQLPFRATPNVTPALAVRSALPPEALASAVRAQIRALDPAQPVANVMPVREYLGDLWLAPRFGAVLMGTLATLGLLIAAVGLYGLLAYAVSRRTAEIGLRMALGARPGDALALVLRDGALLVGGGLLVGTAGAWAIGRLLGGSLHEVKAGDPLTFAAVAGVLAVVALLACALPARRASRIDPLAALKSD